MDGGGGEDLDAMRAAHFGAVQRDVHGYVRTLEAMAPGTIGKVRVYRSGRVAIQIGGFDLDVSAAPAPRHHLELDTFTRTDDDGGALEKVADIEARFVAALDVAKIIQGAKES